MLYVIKLGLEFSKLDSWSQDSVFEVLVLVLRISSNFSIVVVC